MKTIEGYDVKIFTDNIEENALEQIKELLSIEVFSDKKIRIMPDVHAGAGCVKGFPANSPTLTFTPSTSIYAGTFPQV